jgi:hypothetical protein
MVLQDDEQKLMMLQKCGLCQHELDGYNKVSDVIISQYVPISVRHQTVRRFKGLLYLCMSAVLRVFQTYSLRF